MKPLYNNEQLTKALFSFQDLMERVNCPFMPLKNTAKEVYDDGKLTDEVHVGILSNEWTKQRQGMFNILLENMDIKNETTGNKIRLEFDGVPVNLTIIKRKYKFFEKPEIRFFGVNEFLLPNPLDKYLKAQYLIR
jgi:hypothetical protein